MASIRPNLVLNPSPQQPSALEGFFDWEGDLSKRISEQTVSTNYIQSQPEIMDFQQTQIKQELDQFSKCLDSQVLPNQLIGKFDQLNGGFDQYSHKTQDQIKQERTTTYLKIFLKQNPQLDFFIEERQKDQASNFDWFRFQHKRQNQMVSFQDQFGCYSRLKQQPFTILQHIQSDSYPTYLGFSSGKSLQLEQPSPSSNNFKSQQNKKRPHLSLSHINQKIGHEHFGNYYDDMRKKIKKKKKSALITPSQDYSEQQLFTTKYGKYNQNLTTQMISLIFINDPLNKQLFVQEYEKLQKRLLQWYKRSKKFQQTQKSQKLVIITCKWINQVFHDFQNPIVYGSNEFRVIKQLVSYLERIMYLFQESINPQLVSYLERIMQLFQENIKPHDDQIKFFNQMKDKFFLIKQVNSIKKDIQMIEKKLKRCQLRYDKELLRKDKLEIKIDMTHQIHSQQNLDQQMCGILLAYLREIELDKKKQSLEWQGNLKQLKAFLNDYYQNYKNEPSCNQFYDKIIHFEHIYANPIKLLWLVDHFPQKSHEYFWKEIKKRT